MDTSNGESQPSVGEKIRNNTLNITQNLIHIQEKVLSSENFEDNTSEFNRINSSAHINIRRSEEPNELDINTTLTRKL